MNKPYMFEARKSAMILIALAPIFACDPENSSEPWPSDWPDASEGPWHPHRDAAVDCGSADGDACPADAGIDGPASDGDASLSGETGETDAGKDSGPPPSVVPTWAMPFRGVNLAGAEFGTAIPGRDGSDYKFPTNAEIDYFVGKGMNTFRIGFKWERMQASAYAELVSAYVRQLDSIVAYATTKGAFAVLNPHNFARYYNEPVGSSSVPNAVFADFWKRLASRYVDNPRVMFNLVNEPRDMKTEQWVGAANAAIKAIRSTGAKNAIIVPGNGWTGAHSWTSSWYGTPNAVAMLDIVDSGNNILFEAHQYLDDNSAGASSECTSTTAGVERLRPFVNWLKTNGKKGFLGEFAGADNATCNTAVRGMLDYMMENTDVLVGWLWWAAGPYWGEYRFTIEPRNGRDRPQMNLLEPYLVH